MVEKKKISTKKSGFKVNLLPFLFFSFFSCYAEQKTSSTYDLTVVSSIDFNGSVRRHAIGLIDCLKNEIKINFIASRPVALEDVDLEVQQIILSPDKTPGNIALLEDPLDYAEFVPQESQIKIAFSVCESTQIPLSWVNTLNTKFDAVVVADPFFLNVYENSGVTIPIFCIPLGIYIREFLEKPVKMRCGNPFIFRCSARFFYRKNHLLLIRAFACEFGNRKDVQLHINGGGKWGNESVYKRAKELVHTLDASNIFISNEPLSWKSYVEMMFNTDCYVNISQGEGFSISPRESLALGIPTIITNNTAQRTICSTGFVRPVLSLVKIPSYTRTTNEYVGYKFNCRLEDVKEALHDVYHNYSLYLAKARLGREWVKQYLWSNLQQKYVNLIKPKCIIFGDRNEVTNGYMMTNSEELYKKYIDLVSN